MAANPMYRSPEWLAQHRKTIGGSNAAAAVGLHQFKTPLALYYEMVLGQAEDLETNPDALRGILLESVARERLARVLDVEIEPHDQNDFIRCTTFHWAHALPDGWVKREGVGIPLEIKVPTPENFRKLDEAIPDYIACQCIHNCAVLGAPALLLACLNPVTMQVHQQLHEPVPSAVEALMEAEERLWTGHIVPRIPPPPRTEEDLKLRWAEHSPGKRVQATEEIEIAWSELLAVMATAKHAEGRKEELRFTIKNFMEDGEILMSESGTILATYRSHIETKLDSKLLKADAPDIWDRFAREKHVRVFLPKTPK